MKERKNRILAIMLVMWLVFCGLAVVEWHMPQTKGHVVDDAGDTLQLFSYYNPQVTTDVTIDGDIAQNAPFFDEWDGAYVREITFSDFAGIPTTFPGYLFFQNDDDWLYIAVLYQTSNSNQANSASLYFDEGNEAGRYDGGHDDTPSATNENYVMTNLNGATLEDGFWDGAAWDTTDGDGLYHFDSSANSGGNYLKYEFRVPFDAKEDGGGTGSDLNIVRDDELGFFISIWHAGFASNFYWDKTSNDPTDFTSFADLKLGIMTKDRSFYSTFSKNSPTIDGDITNDFGWSDCYQRDILLTNYEGTILNATIFISQDPLLGHINIGFIIMDDDNNANDVLRLYFEQGSAAGPFGPRTGALSGGEQPGGPEWEHYQQVSSQGVYQEGWFDAAAGEGTWKDDAVVGGEAADDGDADTNYYNPTGSANDRYEFEFLVPYDLASPYLVDGDYDLWITNHDLIGMLIRFYDSDMPAGEEYFFWDVTSNADSVMTSDSPDRHIAPGWAYLQTGCAWVRLVSPVDGSTVNGNDYTFRIDADDEDGVIGDDISFVGFQMEGETTWTSLSQRASGSYIFETTWDTTRYDNGLYDIRIVVQDNDGVTMWRTITVAVVNPTSIAPPTGVVITSPAPGTISGTNTIFVTAVNADRLELYVDGVYVNDMAPTGIPNEYSYTLNTKNYDDGFHQLRARAINGAGESSGYETYTFDNWDDLLSVSIVTPTAGEMLSGVSTIYVDFEDDSQDNTAYPGPGYAELYVDNILTVVEYMETEWPVDNWGYEITLDTVWFKDGSHTLKTLVYDPEGNSLADTVLVNFVNEPSLQIMQPATGEVISGTAYPLTIKATDPNGDPIADLITNPQYRVDYGMWYDMSNTLSIGNVVISEVMYEHPVSAAEWVELFNPTSGDISIAGLSLTDDSGVFFTFPGGAAIPAWGTIVVATNAVSFETVYGYLPDYDAAWGAERLGDGGDYIDFAGGTDYVCWESAGLGWTIWASPGRSLQRNPYIDSDTESDWLWDVSTVTPGIAAPVFYTSYFDTTTLSDGPHVIEFQVTDITGALATGSVNVIVDNILLDSISITNPQPGDIIMNMYTVIVDPAPESEAQYAELYVDDAFAAFDGALDVSGNFEFSLLTTGYADGPHNLKIMIYDLYDNSIVNTTSVLIQNKPSLYVVSPKGGEVIRGIYQVNISAVDTDGVLDDESPRPRYRIDGGTTWYDLDLLGGTSNYISDPGEFDTTVLTEGTHTIEFEVMDNGPYGITTMRSVEVIVDNSRPTGFPVLPSLGQNIEGTYTFSIMANDNLDVDRVDITFNNIGGSDIWNLGTKRATYNSFTGYHELTVVTTIYTDGDARVTVNIYDKAGNVNDPLSPITLDYYIDNSEPILSILLPGDDQYVSGAISSILASATDGPFTPIVEYKIDTGSWNLMGGGPINWAANWDTTLYKAGEHSITVRARDTLNHISQQTVNVVVDNQNPICAILSPVLGDYTEDTLTIRVHASDSVGIDYVNVTVFGSTATATYNSGTGYYEYIRSTTSYPDGTYDITATAYDFSGKTITDGPITFYVDNTDPSLTILQPMYGEYVSGIYPVWANANDVFLDTVEYKIDSTNWVAMLPSAPYIGLWDTTNFADGEHTVTVRAVDLASHTVENSIVVWVDNSQPTLSLRSPIPDEYVGGMYTFQVASMDTVGIDYIEIDVFGIVQLMSYNPLTGYYEYTVNTYTQTDGAYDVTITSYDLSGKSVTVGPRSFNVDNNAPLLTIDDPSDGQYVFGDHILSITSTDTFISTVEYKIDTTEWIAMVGPAPTWTANLNTSQYTDGAHVLTIRSTDSAGHVTEQWVEIIVDNTDPEISVSMPIVNQYIHGVFTFQIAADDSPSVDYIGIDYVEISVFGETHYATYNAQTGYYEYTVSTYSLTDGTYNVSAWAADLSGRSTSAGPMDFNVDNNAPILVMNHPKNSEFMDEVYTLNVSVSDAFVLSVEYRIDMTNWLTMTQTSGSIWEAQWNTSIEVDGAHRVSVRALDYSGKLTQQYVDIYVDNFAPTCTIVSPAANQYIEDIFTFQIQAVDGVGIDYVFVSVYNLVFNATYNMQSGYFEFPLDTRLEPEDNVRNVSAWAYDLSGKSATDGPVYFMVDNHPPVLNIIYPEMENYISGEVYVNISAQDAFIGPQEYNVDDRGWDPIVVPWNTSAITDGWHTLSIRVFDMMGHLTQQTINVYVDNTAPRCSIISPVWDQFLERIYTFEISATDLVGIDYVNIDVFNMTVEIPYNSETGYYEYSIDTRTVDDGTYDIMATAYDRSGKASYMDLISFRVDNTPPDLTIISPKNGEYIKQVISIDVQVNDTFDYTVRYTVDDSGWTEIENLFNTTLVSDNEHLITVRATDEAGHVIERTVTVIVDNIAPELVILGPKNGTHVTGEILISVYAGGGVQKVTMSIDDQMGIDLVSVGTNAPYEITLDTRELEDGLHTIYINSIDFTGQESNRESQIFVDNSGPEIVIVRPGSFSHRVGTIKWEINATDDTHVAGVYLKFDSGEWRAMLFDNYTNNYTFRWLTTEDNNREYDYEIKTVDTLGNEEIVRGRITVENPTNLWRAFQENLAGIGFMFLIFFIVLCFVLLKVGKLQSWYREEKKAPKANAKAKKHGRSRGIFARNKKGVPKGDVAVSESADEIVHEFEKIDDMGITVAQAKQLPPPPPPEMGKKSMMESIGDMEITSNDPPTPSDTVDVQDKATTTMGEMEALSLSDSETPKTKDDIKGEKKAKKKHLKKKKK